MDLIDIYNKLRKEEGFEEGKPASSEDIQKIEKELNVFFPSLYKEILLKFGYIAWNGGEIFGFSADPYYDVVSKTKYARAEDLPVNFSSIPSNTVVISKYPGGGYYLLHCEDSPKPGQISLILDETYYNTDQTWNNIFDFLSDALL